MILEVELLLEAGRAQHLQVTAAAAPCLQNAGDSNCHIRRSACFGLAVCAQHGGASFAPMVPTCLQAMHGIVTAAGSREGENKEATDNAIDAIATSSSTSSTSSSPTGNWRCGIR